jgi:hypothetical protein
MRDQVKSHGATAAGFVQMLDVMEGMVKYHDRSLEAVAAQLKEDRVSKASLEYVKKLSSGQPTPFSTYLKNIDLTEFPVKLCETDGTGSEPSENR